MTNDLIGSRRMFCFCGPVSLGFLSNNRLQGQECVLFYNIMTLGTFVIDFQKHPIGRLLFMFILTANTPTLDVSLSFFSASFDFKWPYKFALVRMFYSEVTIGVPYPCGTALTLSHPAVLSLAHLPQSACVNITAILMWINPQPSFLYSWGNSWQGDIRLTYKILSRRCLEPK